MEENEDSRLKSDKSPWKTHVKSLFQDKCSEPETSDHQSIVSPEKNAQFCEENVEEEPQEDARPPPRKRR